LTESRSATVTIIDGSEEAESDCDDGSDYDKANYDAEDDNDPRYSKTLNTTYYLFPQELLESLE
jgi:hypothetical protein